MTTCVVVEDSQVIREITLEMLKELGIAAVGAESINDGVRLCREHSAEVVLLDWDMPGLAALDFLKIVSEFEIEKPEIILCATENDAQQFTLARAAGAAHHILKPFNKEDLLKLFDTIDLLGNIEVTPNVANG